MEGQEKMTAAQASAYTRQHDQQGKGLSISYLVRAANVGRIKGEKIESGPVPYWLFTKETIDEYLNSPRARGRKPGYKPKAEDASE
jgi:hypothetical protein